MVAASVQLTAPEFVAVWAELVSTSPISSPAANALGLGPWLASEDFLEIGRLLLVARAESEDPSVMESQLGDAIAVIARSDDILRLHRDGSVNANRLVFLAADLACVLSVTDTGFEVVSDTRESVVSDIPLFARDLKVSDRLYLTREFRGALSEGCAWTAGRGRHLDDGQWTDVGELEADAAGSWMARQVLGDVVPNTTRTD